MNTFPIPFYKPSLPPLPEYVRLLERVWETRMLSNFATFSQQLEGMALQYLGSPYVKSVVSADVGLIITLKALEVGPAPCFVSDFTFNSTINACLWAGLRPVLVDIDPDSLNISVEALADAMKKHKGPGVILATHVFGNPADVYNLQTLAKEKNCFLVFDAAHALGSKVKGYPIGRFGDAEVFSLSGTKVVTSAEGGFISTSHAWLAEKLVYLRAYGFQHDYNSRYVGINGKISELHSALGILGLAQIEELLERRFQIVAYYQSRLKDRVRWQAVQVEDRSTYNDLAIGAESARLIEKRLNADRIQTKRYFLPLHFMKPYREFADGNYPASEKVYETTLCIPAYSDLSTDDLDRISNHVLAET